MGNSAVLCSPAAPAVLHRDYQYTHYHQHYVHWWTEKHELTCNQLLQHMTYCHMCHEETLTQHQLWGRLIVMAVNLVFKPWKVGWRESFVNIILLCYFSWYKERDVVLFCILQLCVDIFNTVTQNSHTVHYFKPLLKLEIIKECNKSGSKSKEYDPCKGLHNET